jgi:hypothetical protein
MLGGRIVELMMARATSADAITIAQAMDSSENPSIRLMSMTALGPFSWRWPENVENFDRGWAAVASVDDQEIHVASFPNHRHHDVVDGRRGSLLQASRLLPCWPLAWV